MTIQTKSAFIYGHTITGEVNALTFNEGASNISLTLSAGNYSLTEFSSLISTALNAVGSLIYSTSINRTTRKITISATGVFSLLPSATDSEASVFSLIGITSDKTGSSSYEGDTASGAIYLPQFWLQDYVDLAHNKKHLDGMVKESASGIPEVVSFGIISEMECNITFINDFDHPTGAHIENNQNGVADAISFMDYCIGKGNLEFIPDRDNPDSFNKVLLVKTTASGNGIAYKLKELINRNISGYYEFGKVVFKEVN